MASNMFFGLADKVAKNVFEPQKGPRLGVQVQGAEGEEGRGGMETTLFLSSPSYTVPGTAPCISELK